MFLYLTRTYFSNNNLKQNLFKHKFLFNFPLQKNNKTGFRYENIDQQRNCERDF